MVKWIAKEDYRNFCLEAQFLTHWGVWRELRKSGFVRSPSDSYGLKTFVRYWPDGLYAVARVHPGIGVGSIKVTITYYDNKGRKYRNLPINKKQIIPVIREPCAQRIPRAA